jgi:hypothetical protein
MTLIISTRPSRPLGTPTCSIAMSPFWTKKLVDVLAKRQDALMADFVVLEWRVMPGGAFFASAARPLAGGRTVLVRTRQCTRGLNNSICGGLYGSLFKMLVALYTKTVDLKYISVMQYLIFKRSTR